MDIVNLISEKVKDIAENGKLDLIVEKHALSCLEDIVKDSFTWNGEAKKSMKAALEGKLEITLKDCNLDKYHKMVTTIVEEKINGSIVDGLRADIGKSINEITGILEKKTWKLSEIISKFIEDIDKSYNGDMDEHYGELTLIVEEGTSGYFHVYFDMEADKSNYSCKNEIHISKEGQIYHAKADEKDFSPFISNNLYGFNAFLFKLYCNNATIEIDRDNCETEYYREDYD